MWLKNLYLKTKNYPALDLPFYFKSGSWVIGSKTVVQLVNLLIAIIFTRLASKELFGNYKFILAILSLLSIFSLPGFKEALLKYVAEDYNNIYQPVRKMILRWSLVGSLVILLISYYYLILENNNLFAKIFLIAAVFFPLIFFDLWKSFFSAKLKFKKLFIFNLIQSVFLLITIFLILLLSKNLLLLITTYLIIISLFNLIYNHQGEVKNQGQASKAEVKKVKKYGRFLNFLQVINLSCENLDKIILNVFLGPQNLATYAFAIIIPKTLKEYANSLLNIIVPKLVKMDEAKIKSKIKSNLLLIIATSIIASAILIITIPYFIKILFTKQYADAIPYAQLMSLILIFAPLTKLVAKYALAKEKKYIYSLLNNYSQFVAIILYFILIPIWGIQGAIYSTLITTFSQFCFSLYFIRK